MKARPPCRALPARLVIRHACRPALTSGLLEHPGAVAHHPLARAGTRLAKILIEKRQVRQDVAAAELAKLREGHG